MKVGARRDATAIVASLKTTIIAALMRLKFMPFSTLEVRWMEVMTNTSVLVVRRFSMVVALTTGVALAFVGCSDDVGENDPDAGVVEDADDGDVDSPRDVAQGDVQDGKDATDAGEDADDGDAGDIEDAGDDGDTDNGDAGGEPTDCQPGQSPFGGGDGTETSPYLICSADQFAEVGAGDGWWDDDFELAADIDVSTVDVFPIGDGEDVLEDRFEGRFYGAGHTVEGVEIEQSDREYVGVFGYIEEGAVVEDLVLEGISIVGDHHVGGVAGRSEGEIRDVVVEGDVDGDGWHVGGLVGYNEGLVTSSTARADVEGGSEEVGGLAGTNGDEATVEDSAAEGDVTGEDESVGGLIGLNDGVVERSVATGQVDGQQYVGGLVGSNREAAVVTDSYAAGTVEGDEQVGGLVGSHRLVFDDTPLVERCWSAGTVDGTDDVGGLVGETDGGDVQDSYWDEQIGPSTSDGGQGLATADFGNAANFESWDFDDVWEIGEAPDGQQRPVLVGQGS